MTEHEFQQAQQLMAQGVSQREAARQVGVAESTLRGWLKREGLAPVQTPVQHLDTGAEHSADTGAVQALDTGAVQRLDRLEGEVQGLMHVVRSLVERLDTPAVQTPVQITTLPPLPKGKAVRWNLWIHEAIREEVAALAAQRGLSPSQFVQELLWRALRDVQPSSTEGGVHHG